MSTGSSAANTVQYTMGVVEPSVKEACGGSGTISSAGTSTLPPRHPGAMPHTRSPTRRLPTPAAMPAPHQAADPDAFSVYSR